MGEQDGDGIKEVDDELKGGSGGDVVESNSEARSRMSFEHSTTGFVVDEEEERSWVSSMGDEEE